MLEEAVLRYYSDAITIPLHWLDQIRAGVGEAVRADHSITDELRAQYAKRVEALKRKESYFLDLAAEEGWPKDVLREKIDSIRVERDDIQHTIERSEQRLDIGRQIFYNALALLDNPQAAYERGDETVRSILNKAFFTKLYVDGNKVLEHELNEPFDLLVGAYREYTIGRSAGDALHERSAESKNAGLLMESGVSDQDSKIAPVVLEAYS